MRFFIFLLLCGLFLDGHCQQHFSLPLRSLKLTSTFGPRQHPILKRADFHKGIDLSARTEPVLAVLPGRVAAVGYDSILGHFVRLDHGQIQTIYGHLRLVCVSAGQMIDAAQVLGVTGSSGRSTGEHLHFAVSHKGNYLDPLDFLWGLWQMEGNKTN